VVRRLFPALLSAKQMFRGASVRPHRAWGASKMSAREARGASLKAAKAARWLVRCKVILASALRCCNREGSGGRQKRASRNGPGSQGDWARQLMAVRGATALRPRPRSSGMRAWSPRGARALDSGPDGWERDREDCGDWLAARRRANEGRGEQPGAKAIGQGYGPRHGTRRRSDVCYGGRLK
jgi:hypothetical protein